MLFKKFSNHIFLNFQTGNTEILTSVRVNMSILLLTCFYMKAFLLSQLRTKVTGSEHLVGISRNSYSKCNTQFAEWKKPNCHKYTCRQNRERTQLFSATRVRKPHPKSPNSRRAKIPLMHSIGVCLFACSYHCICPGE